MINKMYENFDLSEFRIPTHEEMANSLDTARTEGYGEGFEKGYAQGKDDALTEHDLNLLKVKQALEVQIQELLSQTTNYIQAFDETVQKSVLVLFQTLLPTYMSNQGKDELSAFIQNTLQRLLRKEDLCIYVHPSMVDAIVIEGDVKFLSKKSLAPYECEIKWDGGGANFSLENLSQTLINLLKGNSDD